MKRNVRCFTAAIIGLGILNVVAIIRHVELDKEFLPVLFFMIMAVLSESLSVTTGENTAVSLGFAVSLAAVIQFDPLQASAIVFTGSLLQFDNSEGSIQHIFNTSFYKRLFNSSAYMLGVLVTTYLYQLLTIYDWHFYFGTLPVLPIIFAVGIYFMTHMMLFIPLFSMLENKSMLECFKEQFWISRHLVALAPFGILISFAYLTYGWFMVLLIFGPLMIARMSFVQYMDTKRMYFETIETLSTALDAKDEYTNGHSKRVSEYAMGIAHVMKISKYQKELILNASLMHDIGKIGISDAIIKKEGKLSLGELYEIKRHPEIGEKIIGKIGFLKDVSQIIRHHHERYDGNGYPDALAGDEIPLESSILAVADAYDAMTSDRPYRKAMEVDLAIEIILNESNKQFHPQVVEAFKRYIEKNGSAEKDEDEAFLNKERLG